MRMKHFKYWDNGTPWRNFNERKLLFEVAAENIFKADECYQRTTVDDPDKQPYVGREIHDLMGIGG
jgi:hypothetical protein